MSDIEAALTSAVERLIAGDRVKKIADWINGYDGKVIQFKSPEEDYCLVFTKAGAFLRRGEYPSCDVTYIGSREALLRILKGESSARAEMRAGDFKIWGNLHETYKFEAVLR
ncbi:MAG: hypothetical protein HYX92_11595 [Chloroflexi bacterium]|nr:hypothetical protein [Chloroflexota bacterium]